jgi:hypothetical protein
MTVSEAVNGTGCRLLNKGDTGLILTGGYTTDLLSDAMGHAREGMALITIQAHKNTVAVASLLNLPLIIICNDRPVPDDMITSAEQEGILLALTADNQFTVSWKLADALKADGTLQG